MLSQRLPKGLLAILLTTLALVAASGVALYRSQETRIRHHAESDLETIAVSKVQQIVDWREDRLADAGLLSEDPFFREGVADWLATQDPVVEANLLDTLREYSRYYRYSDALIVDTSGKTLLSLSGDAEPVGDEGCAVLKSCLASGGPALTDLHCTAESSEPRIDAIAPLRGTGVGLKTPIAAVILRANASDYLYPLVQSWPAQSETAETLLVKKDGEEALVLNDLRHQEGAALMLRIGLNQAEVPAVQAAQGNEGVVNGADYRGVKVLGVAKRVPDSPWYMVAKVDSTEALAEWRDTSPFILGFVFLLLVASASGISVAWHRNEASHLRKLLASERDRRETEISLAQAQRVARLGSWRQDVKTGAVAWSDQIYRFFRLEPLDRSLTVEAFLDKMHPEDRSELMPADDGSMLMPGEVDTEIRSNPDYGEVRHFAVRTEPETDKGGNVIALIGTLHDITRRKVAEDEVRHLNANLERLVDERTEELHAAMDELEATDEELQAANEELQVTNDRMQILAEDLRRANDDLTGAIEGKDRFIREMSHELRTPLNSIIGFSDLMLRAQGSGMSEEQRHQLSIVHDSGLHLLDLINDLLDLSRIEARKVDVVARPIDVGEFARLTLETVAPAAQEKGVDCILDIDDPSMILKSDPQKVRQILLNLLGNAVKFTDSGAIRLRAWRASHDAVSFSIVDTGPGIPLEDHERIFRDFVQGDGTKHREEGTGLGLAISRGLTHLLGGRLTVESRVGEGATFTLTLPIEYS